MRSLFRSQKRTKHNWAHFQKGRVRVKACSICGEMHLPNNNDGECSQSNYYSSQIFKAGYRLAEESLA